MRGQIPPCKYLHLKVDLPTIVFIAYRKFVGDHHLWRLSALIGECKVVFVEKLEFCNPIHFFRREIFEL